MAEANSTDEKRVAGVADMDPEIVVYSAYHSLQSLHEVSISAILDAAEDDDGTRFIGRALALSDAMGRVVADVLVGTNSLRIPVDADVEEPATLLDTYLQMIGEMAANCAVGDCAGRNKTTKRIYAQLIAMGPQIERLGGAAQGLERQRINGNRLSALDEAAIH